MAIHDSSELKKFLSPFPVETIDLALWLREFVWKLYPECNELIYDSYNAVAFGWSITDKLGDSVCSIAVGRSSYNVHFGFYWGSKIKDTEKILLGKGNQYRYLLVKDKKDFPKTYIRKLMNDAYVYSLGKLKDKKNSVRGITTVKAIATKKRAIAKSLSKKKK